MKLFSKEELPIKIKYYGTYAFGLDSSIEINNKKYWVLEIRKGKDYTVLIVGGRNQEADQYKEGE